MSLSYRVITVMGGTPKDAVQDGMEICLTVAVKVAVEFKVVKYSLACKTYLFLCF